MFSLKFCTAIEWPAPISTWPRCCSSAFIGTTKKPAHAPMTTISTMASGSCVTKIIAMTIEAHRDADRQHLDRAAQRHEARGDDRADRDADGDHALQHRRLRQVEAERLRRPIDAR